MNPVFLWTLIIWATLNFSDEDIDHICGMCHDDCHPNPSICIINYRNQEIKCECKKEER